MTGFIKNYAVFFFFMLMALPCHADTTTGLVAWWKFNDASGLSAADSTGNGNTATLTNPQTWTSGKRGGALNFNGVDDKVTLADLPITTTFTIAFWIFPQGGSIVYETIFSVNFDQGIYFYDTVNKIGVYNTAAPEYFEDTVLTLNEWHHIAVSVSAGTLTFYVDGRPDGTGAMPLGFTANRIGNDDQGESLNGNLDDMRVYNRALSASDVRELYLDASVNNATIRNATIK